MNAQAHHSARRERGEVSLRIQEVEVQPTATRRLVAGHIYGSSLFYIIRIRADEDITGIGEASDILHHEPPDLDYLTKQGRRELHEEALERFPYMDIERTAPI